MSTNAISDTPKMFTEAGDMQQKVLETIFKHCSARPLTSGFEEKSKSDSNRIKVRGQFSIKLENSTEIAITLNHLCSQEGDNFACKELEVASSDAPSTTGHIRPLLAQPVMPAGFMGMRRSCLGGPPSFSEQELSFGGLGPSFGGLGQARSWRAPGFTWESEGDGFPQDPNDACLERVPAMPAVNEPFRAFQYGPENFGPDWLRGDEDLEEDDPGRPLRLPSSNNGDNEEALQRIQLHQKHVCMSCRLEFATKPGLLKHSQILHGRKPYLCKTCGKSFSDNKGLRRHYQRGHDQIVGPLGASIEAGELKEKRFKCTMCKYSTNVRHDLGKHYKKAHKRNISSVPEAAKMNPSESAPWTSVITQPKAE